MNICHFCGNKNFKDIEVEYTYKKNGHYMIVRDVPCKQCEYCGEQYFQAKNLKDIEQEFHAIYSKGKSVKKKLVVPTESFKEIPHSNVSV